MTKRISTLNFKAISPFYEMHKSGEMPFTIRKYDRLDSRFRIISKMWDGEPETFICFINPSTEESFTRKITGTRYVQEAPDNLNFGKIYPREIKPLWMIIYFEVVKND